MTFSGTHILYHTRIPTRLQFLFSLFLTEEKYNPEWEKFPLYFVLYLSEYYARTVVAIEV